MSKSDEVLREWFGGRKASNLRFSDLWKLFLVRIAERVWNLADEEEQFVTHLSDGPYGGPYSYDLAHVAEHDEIRVGAHDLQRVAAHLEQHGWCHLNRRGPVFISLTRAGFEKGIKILNEALELKDEDTFQNWLLVAAYQFTNTGPPLSQEDGAVDLQRIANSYLARIPHSELSAIVAQLEAKNLLARKPSMLNKFMWVNILPEGIESAKSFVLNGNNRAAIPAADRFVQLDDNSPAFNEAVTHLEKLISEVKNARRNDWPEQEGVLQSLRSALEMIRTKYVNKSAVLALVSTAVGYITLKFLDAPIVDLANRAWSAVKNLF